MSFNGEFVGVVGEAIVSVHSMTLDLPSRLPVILEIADDGKSGSSARSSVAIPSNYLEDQRSELSLSVAPHADPHGDLVLDVGAHIGEDSDFYLSLGYRVVGIEPNPILAEWLRRRFSQEIRDGRYTVVQRAVGDTEVDVTFYLNKKYSSWGTTTPQWADRNRKMGAESEAITVRSVRFAEILKTHGCPHYLKIDIEGADMLCVNALFEAKCRPKYISIESTKTSWRALLNEFDTLERLGYTRFKVVDQKCHKPGDFAHRNGKMIRHAFQHGASGPFGESLDGPWLTKWQALRTYASIFFLYKTVGDNQLLGRVLQHVPFGHRILDRVSWYDTHARRD